MPITQVTIDTLFDEWKDITNDIINAIGDNDTLSTTDKTTLVAAINEVLTQLGDITSLSTTDKTSAVAAINEVLTQLGDISSLDATFVSVTNLVAACNNLVNRIGDLTTLSTTAKNNLVVAINEVNSSLGQAISDLAGEVGDLTALSTTEQSNLVGAINELVTSIGDLTALSTTEQSNLVGALNEVVTSVTTVDSRVTNEVGDLTALNTTDQSSAVAAINELVANALTRSVVPVENLLTNHGRFSAETPRVLTTFDATMNQLVAYNAAVLAAGDRFIDDNSNYGGAGGALGTDVGALMTAIQGAGRTDNQNGYEFFLCDITCGGGTADGEVFTQNYYPMLEGGDFFIAPIGTTVTFQCWLRLKSIVDEPTFGGLLLGDAGGTVSTEIDGVSAAQQSILAVAGGWVHIRQTATLTNEFKQFFPAIYANNGDVVQIALPTLYAANVNNGIHLGVQ